MRIETTITDWMSWDHIVHQAVETFRDKYKVSPNALLASDHTFRRIDMAADRTKLHDSDGNQAAEGEYAPMSSFNGADYHLGVFLDEGLATGVVAVMLLDDDGGGGEEDDVDDDEEEDERLAG
jgi:hypothetical protein